MLLQTKNLKVYFKHQDQIVKALDGVDISLDEGLIYGVAGESGSGKTTLARAILGFHKLHAGKIYFQNEDISLRKNKLLICKNIQIVFQNPYLSLDPHYTIFSTLYEVLCVFKKINKAKGKEIIKNALGDVELEDNLLYRYPHQLSGGQLQRVCIARALINKPSLVILDEPTSSLDINTSVNIINLLTKLQKNNQITFLFISHNLKLLRKISNFCFIMHYGKIVESGTRESIYQNPQHPYTKLLLSASRV